MAAGVLNLTIEQGATYRNVLTWKDSNSVPINLTGYSAQMQIRASAESPTPILELTNANGRISLGTANGQITLYISPADTAALDFKSAVYDLLLTDAGGDVTRLVEGRVALRKGVTQ